MTHQEAHEILNVSSSDIEFNEDMSVVDLQGEFTIEELHAILQLMEYNA